jgi:hypothetical protein
MKVLVTLMIVFASFSAFSADYITGNIDRIIIADPSSPVGNPTHFSLLINGASQNRWYTLDLSNPIQKAMFDRVLDAYNRNLSVSIMPGSVSSYRSDFTNVAQLKIGNW